MAEINFGAAGTYEIEFPDFLFGGEIWRWYKIPTNFTAYCGFIPEASAKRHSAALFHDYVRNFQLRMGKRGPVFDISYSSGYADCIPADQIKNILFPTREAAQKARLEKMKVVDPRG